MAYKKVFVAVSISIVMMIVLLFWLYDFNLTWLNASNVLFSVGAMYFFPGLIGVTGAGSLFNGMDYAAKVMFMRKKKADKYFKTFGDYMEHKKAKESHSDESNKGLVMLVVGGIYIAISLSIGYII